MASDGRKAGLLHGNLNWLIVVVGCLLVVSLIAALPSRRAKPQVTEPQLVNVEVERIVSVEAVEDILELPGVVEPNRIVTISAQVAGSIVRIAAVKGTYVQKGQLIVQLDDDLIRPQLESAQAQLLRDQVEFERIRGLIATDAAAKKDLDDATLRLAVSKANVAQITATLERTRITSSISGILNALPVEEGQYVQPGMAVAEVVQMDPVKVVVDMPERDVSFFGLGAKAKILVDVAGNGTSMDGQVTFISQVAHPQTRSTRMEISVANPMGILRGGRIVTIALTRRIIRDAIMVPLRAVIPMEDGKAVFVVGTDGLAIRKTVELGIMKVDRVQVISGLEQGELLVVEGHRFLVPGQPVRIIAGL